MPILRETDWQERSRIHRRRAFGWTAAARRRRAAGIPHPVEDFLFTYYTVSFSKLAQWHPGIGTWLKISDAPQPPLDRAPYRFTDGKLGADPSLLTVKQRGRLRWTLDLLVATRDRPAHFACHGIHEWAMVYRGTQVRHGGSAKLRLPQSEIDALVESRPITCSHFDAYRFFHRDALPLNRLKPALLTRQDFEQPGCVHANMDLYKWAAKNAPWVGSRLVLDAFELALELRDLDMRASPYDLRTLGLDPIAIETPAGRHHYETEQRRLAASAIRLRTLLIERLAITLVTASASPERPQQPA